MKPRWLELRGEAGDELRTELPAPAPAALGKYHDGAEAGHPITALIDRLERGRAAYGDLELDGDQRCWRREILEEVLDALVYSAAGIVQNERKIR